MIVRHNTDLCLEDNDTEEKEIIAPYVLKHFYKEVH